MSRYHAIAHWTENLSRQKSAVVVELSSAFPTVNLASVREPLLAAMLERRRYDRVVGYAPSTTPPQLLLIANVAHDTIPLFQPITVLPIDVRQLSADLALFDEFDAAVEKDRAGPHRSGRTTAAIAALPEGAVYVCLDERHARHACRDAKRDGVRFVPLSWVMKDRWVGTATTDVVLDHAVYSQLTPSMRLAFGTCRDYLRARNANQPNPTA